MEYRAQEWDVDFLKYLKKLEQEKPVIFCGDLNVAHKEIDLKNPKTNRKLTTGDILSLNTFPMISRYYTALERTLFLKSVDDESLKAW